jgi:hypothetical protein
MVTGYVLTCGMSVLASRPRPDEEHPPEDALSQELRERWNRVTKGVRNALARSEDGTIDVGPYAVFAGVVSKALKGVEPPFGGALRALGVEAESLARRMVAGQGPVPGRVLRPDDPIALLVSDTDEGRLAGVIIARMLDRPVRMWERLQRPEGAAVDPAVDWVEAPIGSSGPDEHAAAEGPVPVDLYVVAGLKVEDGEQLRSCAQWLSGALVRTVIGQENGEGAWRDVHDVEVELSGGFKATIPLIHTLLEYCASSSAAGVEVFLRHESAAGHWIRSGLRRMPQQILLRHLEELNTVRQEQILLRHLEELNTVRQEPTPEPDNGRDDGPELRGFGWDYVDHARRLTPEGLGISVIPRPAQGRSAG